MGEQNQDTVDWLKGIKFDKKKGEIILSGQRHALHTVNAFRAYRDGIARIIGEGGADAVLYLAGREHTERFVKGLLKKSMMAGMVSKFGWGQKKIMQKLVDVLRQYGFGSTSIEKIDLKGESFLVLDNSCIATNYTRRQKKPVCSYLSGLIAGAMNAVTGKSWEVTETHCWAKGNRHCRFMIRLEKKQS
jgi:predicted hydrocarbon binding protein